MNCEQVRERLVDLHEGVLAADDAPIVRAHLEGCAACRGAFEEIGSLHGRLTRLAESAAAAGPEGDSGAATMVGELTMLRIGARPAGRGGVSGAGRALRWGLPLATAAAACVAVTLWLFVPERASAVTLAQVAENVRKAGSVAYTMKVTYEGGALPFPALGARMTVLGGKRMRVETQGVPDLMGLTRFIIIGDLESGESLMLHPTLKQAKRSKVLPNEQATQTYQTLVNLGKQSGTVIGEETLNGEATRVVRIDTPAFPPRTPQGNHDTSVSEVAERVWIGVKSGLPVRFEQTSLYSSPEGSVRAKITFSDFVFDAVYDPAQFSLDAPAGYKVEGERMAAAPALELATTRVKGLLTAVRAYRQQFERWPSNLAQVLMMDGVNGETAPYHDPRRTGKQDEFLYFRPMDEMLPDEGVIFEPPCEGEGCEGGWSGSGLVGYLDGRVEEVKDRVRYEAMLRRAQQRAAAPR